MPFFAALKALFPSRKPTRSKLLAPLVDPRFEHPAYKNIPEELLRALGDPTYLRNPPYHDGYYGLISGEFCMRKFQGKLMDKLEIQSGLSPHEFEHYLEPIIIAYAELVHLLPASEHHHHNTPGGLLRHGLETACFMLDWMVMTKFDHELTPGQASKRLRRWYVAGIIAALFHDSGKPLTDVRVMSFDGSQKWNMGTKTIHEWAVANNITRYFLTWVKNREDKHLAHTSVLIGTFVTTKIREWLFDGGEDIWQALLDATNDEPGPLTKAVKIADSRSVKADRERSGSSEGEATTGVPIQRLCVDAMRALLDEGKWTFNTPGSRLWKSTQGLFLVWNTGSDDIIQQVVKDKVGGFPRGEISLLAAMTERELIEKAPDGTSVWFVAPHALQKNGKGPAIRCVKLKNPDGVFPSVLGSVSAVSVTIGRDEQAKDYLTEEDEKIRAVVAKEGQKSGQNDLFALAQNQAGGPEKPKKDNRQGPAPAVERRGVSLAPDLAARAAGIKLVANGPALPSEPAETEEADDQNIDLANMDDDTLTNMLMDLNGGTPEVKAEATEPATVAESEPATAVDETEDDTLAEFAQKGFKLQVDDITLKKPVKQKKEQPKPAATAKAVQASALDIPEKFKGKLKQEEIEFLSVNTDLASRLLNEFATNSQIRAVRNKAFIPLVGGISEVDLPELEASGWLWRDFSNAEDERTRTLRHVTGFLASKKLSLIYCRLTKAQWQPACSETLSPELRATSAPIAEALRGVAIAEPAKGEGIYSISFGKLHKTMEVMGVDFEAVETAIFYCLEGIKVGRDKKYYFRVEGQE